MVGSPVLAIDEIDVLVHLRVHAEPDDPDAEGLQFRQLGVLLLGAELQGMHEVDATYPLSRPRRARREPKTHQGTEHQVAPGPLVENRSRPHP